MFVVFPGTKPGMTRDMWSGGQHNESNARPLPYPRVQPMNLADELCCNPSVQNARARVTVV